MRSSPRQRSAVIKAQQLVPRGQGPQGARRPAPGMPAQGPESAADHIIDVARQVARATLEIAQRDAESLRRAAERDASRRGFQAGRKAGYAEGLKAAEADARRIVAEAEAAAREIVERAQAEIGQLACEVAAHLIGSEIRLNPEVVERAVLEVLQEAPLQGAVSIEVSPADLERMLRALPALQAAAGAGAELSLAQNADLPQGGMRVSGPQGVVERNWREGLVAISEAFEEVSRHGV